MQELKNFAACLRSEIGSVAHKRDLIVQEQLVNILPLELQLWIQRHKQINLMGAVKFTMEYLGASG